MSGSVYLLAIASSVTKIKKQYYNINLTCLNVHYFTQEIFFCIPKFQFEQKQMGLDNRFYFVFQIKRLTPKQILS